MASYQGHLSVSIVLGTCYGGLGVSGMGMDWGEAFLGMGLTSLGGLLPDLDSDSGVPVRELFGLAAAAAPFLLFSRVRAAFTLEQTIVLLAGVYLLIRYGVSEVFKRATVHRGMFHSIPGMLVAGLLVFLSYDSPSRPLRCYLAVGVMLGFLSHLILDELCSVDFMGARLHISKSAGSALKFYSPSWAATVACYMFLSGLLFVAWVHLKPQHEFGAPWAPRQPAPSQPAVSPARASPDSPRYP
jgi:membrane-bound metal-dependent hydrolase YbcI (DUF457 family)